MNRNDAMRNRTINVQGIPGQPVVNQVVQGGVAMINPICNGNYEQIKVVPQQNRVQTKYENRRRDNHKINAIYDIRSNQSRISGQPLNELHESAKQKVFNKPSINYRFEGNTINDMNGNQINTYNEYNNDYSLAEFYDTSCNEDEGTISIVGYNPFLESSSQNKSHGLNNTRADERLNHYTNERAYMSKGDRIKQAAALAKSSDNVQKRLFQQNAWEQATGHVRAPRKVGTNLYSGVNVRVNDNDEMVFDIGSTKEISNDKRENYIPINNLHETDKSAVRNKQDNYTVDKNKRSNVSEKFIPRSTDIRSQQHIKQQVSDVYKPIIDRDAEKIRKDDYERKLHYEDEANLFTRIVEGFKSMVEPFMRTIDQNNYQERQGNYESNVNQDYVTQDIALRELLDDDMLDYLRKHPNLFYTVDRGQATKYGNDPNLVAPMFEIDLNDQIVRTIATRETNVINVMLKRTSKYGDEYEMISIPIEEVEAALRRDLHNEPNDRILRLNYEDSLKVCQMAIERPDTDRLKTQAPIHYYQREFLNNNDKLMYFSNLKPEELAKKKTRLTVNDYLIHESKTVPDGNVDEKIDLQQTIKDNQIDNSTAKIKANTASKPSVKNTYSKFNGMF
jgi:hypothetical protein